MSINHDYSTATTRLIKLNFFLSIARLNFCSKKFLDKLKYIYTYIPDFKKSQIKK